jgi:hypothetical protein
VCLVFLSKESHTKVNNYLNKVHSISANIEGLKLVLWFISLYKINKTRAIGLPLNTTYYVNFNCCLFPYTFRQLQGLHLHIQSDMSS